MNFVALSLFSLQLFLLDAFIGAIMMIFAAANAACAIFPRKKIIIFTLVLLPIPAAIASVNSFYDLLPVVAHYTGMIAFLKRDTKSMRIWAPIGTILWAFYNIIVGAWTQFAADIFILISMFIGYLRDRNHKPLA